MANDELDPMKCKLYEAKIELTEDELCATMRALIAVDRKNEASGTEAMGKMQVYKLEEGVTHWVFARNKPEALKLLKNWLRTVEQRPEFEVKEAFESLTVTREKQGKRFTFRQGQRWRRPKTRSRPRRRQRSGVQ